MKEIRIFTNIILLSYIIIIIKIKKIKIITVPNKWHVGRLQYCDIFPFRINSAHFANDVMHHTNHGSLTQLVTWRWLSVVRKYSIHYGAEVQS